MVASNGVIVVTLQNNSDTQLLKINKRFIKYGSAWKVVGLDFTKEGLICLYADKDAVNTSTDNMDMEIADYFNNIHTYTIEISNRNNAEITVNNNLQLNCSCTDNNANVNNPSITYSVDVNNVCTVNSTGLITAISEGTCSITASYNNVKDTINITVKAVPVQHTITYTLVGTSTSSVDTQIAWGRSKSYTATKFIDGVATTGAFDFSIDAMGNQTKLVCKDQADNNKSIEKIITIKSLG